MGLFSRHDSQTIDPTLERIVLAHDDRMRKLTTKELTKSQPGILAALESDEKPMAIIWKASGHLLLITSHRLVDFKGPKIASELRHADIDETAILRAANENFMIKIETVTSKTYGDDDLRKFDRKHYMSVETSDPKFARSVCAIIDAAR